MIIILSNSTNYIKKNFFFEIKKHNIKNYIKMKFNYLFVVLLSIFFSVNTKNALAYKQLSPQAQVSLLTCTPGNELYSLFGHSALRVYDTANQIDYVYNYGTFDFDAPNFYTKFIRGQLDYQLSVTTMDRFIHSYRNEGRGIKEILLNLTPTQKQKMFEFLEENYLPENRFYRYDFFFDNCATRISDALKTAMGDSLIYRYDKTEKKITFRELTDIYLTTDYFAKFYINLGLGKIADRQATPEEYTFLPNFLHEAFLVSEITKNGNIEPLVLQERTILEKTLTVEPTTSLLRPFNIFTIILLLALLLFALEQKFNKYYWGLDFAMFFIVGIIGLLVAFFWFATEHKIMSHNFNLLWAIPFHFFIVFFLIKRKRKQLLKYYFSTSTIITGLVLAVWTVFPQHFPLEAAPLVFALTLRSFRIAKVNF